MTPTYSHAGSMVCIPLYSGLHMHRNLVPSPPPILDILLTKFEFILFPHLINIPLQILSSYVVAKNMTCSSYFLYGLMEQKVTVIIHTVHMVLRKLSKSANNTTQ